MAQLIEYEKMDKMLPREGVTYSTVYVKQTELQRRTLCNHIYTSVREIRDYVESCSDPEDWLNWMQTPLKGFKKTAGTNRSCIDLINDLLAEATGKKKNGDPKDFALAPIERWNKLFKDTDYEIQLEKDIKYLNVKSLFKGL